MKTPLSRRTLLGATSAAVALSMSGCSALDDGSEADSEADNAEAENEPEPQEVTFVADIDDEELQSAQEDVQAAQQEAQQQFQEGDINQTEAQEMVQEARTEFQEARQQLLVDAVEDLESHAEMTNGLTITESAPESGVALGEGDGNAIVEALALDSVQAIVDASEFESFTES